MKYSPLTIPCILLFLFLPVLLCADSHSDKTICGCEDIGGFPPYTFQGMNGDITGFSVEVLQEIFKENGLQFSPSLLPWKRCLYYVEEGEKCDLVINATHSQERAEKYLFSKKLYLTTPGYFYSKQRYPNGLNITNKNDLANYKIGKMLGYNYSEFGPEINDHIIQSKIYSNSYETLIKHLHSGHCVLFLEKIEILSGFKLTGKDLLADGTIGYAKVPNIQPTPFYVLFTNNTTGLKLKKIVDEGLEKMVKSGRISDISKKYFETIPTITPPANQE